MEKNEKTGFNCIRYRGSTIYTHKYYYNWFKVIQELKTNYPENKLVKNISSSFWGSLIKFERNYVIESSDEFDNMNISFKTDGVISDYYIIKTKGYKDKQTGLIDFKHEYVNGKQPYKHKECRLKCFLVEFSRIQMLRTIILNEINIEDIIRIQTDSFVLAKEYKFKGDYIPIPDAKYTGNITWSSSKSYTKN